MRALDDLHALAAAARALPEIEGRILARVAEIQEQFDQALEIGRSLDARGGELTALGANLDAHATAFLELSTGLDEMNRSAEAMAAVAEPLHGAAERLGRIVDRLPGGRAARPVDLDQAG
jgi:methyl-accepting chemotaxis protein